MSLLTAHPFRTQADAWVGVEITLDGTSGYLASEDAEFFLMNIEPDFPAGIYIRMSRDPDVKTTLFYRHTGDGGLVFEIRRTGTSTIREHIDRERKRVLVREISAAHRMASDIA